MSNQIQNTQAANFTSFQGYYEQSVHAYQNNRSRLTYNAFVNRTNRAKRPLSCDIETQFYTAAYAMQHYQSMMAALNEQISMDDFSLHLNIVDYGCGQGVATLAVLDFIAKNVSCHVSLNVHLLEPSNLALQNARELIAARADALGMDLTLSVQCVEIAQVHLPNHIKSNVSTTLHLFSNVLDVVGVQVSLGSVVREIHATQGENIVIASAPNYSDSYKGFRQLSALLVGNANPTIYARTVEHYSYRVIQNRWQTSTALSIHMALSANNDYYNHQVA